MQKVAKAPKASRQVLFSLKYSSKNTPILPLREEDPRKSPLYSLVREDLEYTGQGEEERASQLATEWMGPGPWPLRFNVEIPNTYGGLRPTNMNKKGNITVCHVLKIIIRVEKGNAYEGDGDGLKKKMYDIIIQYPVHLLSVSTPLAPRTTLSKKTDCGSAVSLQPEVYVTTTVLGDVAFRSNETWPTSIFRTWFFERRSRSVRDRGRTPHPGPFRFHRPLYQDSIEREGATHTQVRATRCWPGS